MSRSIVPGGEAQTGQAQDQENKDCVYGETFPPTELRVLGFHPFDFPTSQKILEKKLGCQVIKVFRPRQHEVNPFDDVYPTSIRVPLLLWHMLYFLELSNLIRQKIGSTRRIEYDPDQARHDDRDDWTSCQNAKERRNC